MPDATLTWPDGARLAVSFSLMFEAGRYYAFWDTGDVAYANAALAPDFVDRNLPAGRRALKGRYSRRRTSAQPCRICMSKSKRCSSWATA